MYYEAKSKFLYDSYSVRSPDYHGLEGLTVIFRRLLPNMKFSILILMVVLYSVFIWEIILTVVFLYICLMSLFDCVKCTSVIPDCLTCWYLIGRKLNPRYICFPYRVQYFETMILEIRVELVIDILLLNSSVLVNPNCILI